MAKRKLKKHKVVGDRAFHYFQNNGEELRVPCTIKEYHSLGVKGAGSAVHPDGLSWLRSSIEPEYDSIDGDLPGDSYAVLDNGVTNLIAVKLRENKNVDVTTKDEVVNGEIDLRELRANPRTR